MKNKKDSDPDLNQIAPNAELNQDIELIQNSKNALEKGFQNHAINGGSRFETLGGNQDDSNEEAI